MDIKVDERIADCFKHIFDDFTSLECVNLSAVIMTGIVDGVILLLHNL